MSREAPFLLQIEDEFSDLVRSDGCGIGGQPGLPEELVQVAKAADHRFYRPLALTLCSGVEAVFGGQFDQVGG